MHTLVVEDLVAVTAEARRELWAYCLGFGQAVLVTAPNTPVDDPVGWMLADPRQRTLRVRDFLWLRLLDVPMALSARRYDATGSVVLEVLDPTCAENEGRFRLEADARLAAGACEPTVASADVALRVEDLAATYLGGVGFGTLARAGRVEERRPGRSSCSTGCSPAAGALDRHRLVDVAGSYPRFILLSCEISGAPWRSIQSRTVDAGPASRCQRSRSAKTPRSKVTRTPSRTATFASTPPNECPADLDHDDREHRREQRHRDGRRRRAADASASRCSSSCPLSSRRASSSS